MAEIYNLEFKIDELPDSQADVQKVRIRTRYRKDWHEKVYWAVYQNGRRPSVPLTSVEVYGVRHSSQIPDRINTWYSFKCVVDGLIEAGVILNDSPHVIIRENYTWEYAPPSAGFISVRVLQVPARPDRYVESRLLSDVW